MDYLNNGGTIDRVDENRENWKDAWDYHFDLWPTIGGEVIYVETRFENSPLPDNRIIMIVGAHPPNDSTWSGWKK